MRWQKRVPAPEPLCVTVWPPLLFWAATSEASSESVLLAQAGLRLNGGGSVPEVINSIIKVRGARCLARPWGRSEDCRAGLVGSVPRAGWHGVRASPGCCAQRFSPSSLPH